MIRLACNDGKFQRRRNFPSVPCLPGGESFLVTCYVNAYAVRSSLVSGLDPRNARRFTMRSIARFRRLLFILGTVVLLGVALVGTKLATRPVKAQVAAPIDVFVFHCVLDPSDFSAALVSSNLTFTGAPFINPGDCSKVMAGALNAGYHLKFALPLVDGGTQGTATTEYVFVRGGNQ